MLYEWPNSDHLCCRRKFSWPWRSQMCDSLKSSLLEPLNFSLVYSLRQLPVPVKLYTYNFGSTKSNDNECHLVAAYELHALYLFVAPLWQQSAFHNRHFLLQITCFVSEVFLNSKCLLHCELSLSEVWQTNSCIHKSNINWFKVGYTFSLVSAFSSFFSLSFSDLCFERSNSWFREICDANVRIWHIFWSIIISAT